ncbi:CreA family protein [Sulfurospirillum deleyianum]|uniref:CreA family protein n=1 Tax=Sulfurospirillum deleyianum (strain ATCC 51133 / DSM 6946 / 5175) TaxID=525898 RepID=D1B150_SULD5|nr:CreA family protein [Sulfurospirillum deleyianum]ACZ11820.1 CreA family protein [Sulfurospirillum deleyianum DSM 6946]
MALRITNFIKGISGIVLMGAITLHAEEIGSVDTAFVLVGANHKIVVEAFDDPKIPGVSCHLSRAKTGGMKGTFGIAEDTADASIACRQTGIIHLPQDVQSKKKDGERVFKESTSFLFKHIQVVRFYDAKRHTLVYLTYSDKLIDGSPKNAISTVQISNALFSSK